MPPSYARNLTRHTPGANEQEYGQQENVPFETDRYETTNLYLRLNGLAIRPPRHYNMDFLRRLPIFDTIREYALRLGLMQCMSREWDAHDSLCMEMCCSFRLSRRGNEPVMVCTFRGVLCEISKETMKTVFGFRANPNISDCVPSDFNVDEAWLELTGVNNFKTSGVSSAFLRDDALIILHRFISNMISGKKEVSKVTSMEVYLLWCARFNRKVCMAPFIWTQLSNVQSKRGAHPTLGYVATALARHFGVDISEAEGLVHSVEMSSAELINAHLMRSPTEFTRVEDRASVRAYYADPNRIRRAGQEEGEEEEAEQQEEEEEEAEGDGDEEEQQHVPRDDERLVRYYTRRDRVRARQNMEAEVPPYWADFRADFTHFQQGVFDRFDSLSTQVTGLDRRVSNVESHLMRYTDFSIGSTSAPPNPNDPRYWSPHNPRWNDPRFRGPFDS